MVNFFQTKEIIGGEDVEANDKSKTRVQNFKSKISTHTSIDQDFIGTILYMIQNLTQTKPNKTNTKKAASHEDVEKNQ